MLNYLRYELHKTLKSKTIWVIMLLYLGFRAFTDILQLIRGAMPFMQYYITSGGANDVVFPIMGIILVTKDFSSGYIKNLYKQIKPWLFVLSKFITLVGLVALIMLIDFILTYLVNLVFGVNKFIIATEEYPFSISYLLTICLYYLTSASIGMLVGHLFKKDYIALPVLLVWMLTSHLIYPLIGELVKLIYPSLLAIPKNTAPKVENICRYTHFGDDYHRIARYLCGLMKDDYHVLIKNSQLAARIFYVKEVVFNVIAYIISWLSLKFRRV